MIKSTRWSFLLFLSGIICPLTAPAQIDPVRRDLVQLGYNVPLVGRSPFSGYAFYYRNQPEFLRSNLTLRLVVAPVYVDSELGLSHAFGPHTDLAVGLAGGGFADSFTEVRRGKFLREESFTGHGGEVSLSLYHLFNPHQTIPLYGVLRGSAHYSAFEEDEKTDPAFVPPDDQTSFHVRAGLRWGGQEPLLYPSLAMEVSLWYEGQFRTAPGTYGFGDRQVEPDSHLFWGRGLLAYTFPKSEQSFSVNLTAGASIEADRFSAYRLGALLPLGSEFPLALPGYYYQEISAERFLLLGGNYSVPLDEKKRWNVNIVATTAVVDYLPGLEQPGHWHSGVGGGILYKSPADTLKVVLSYGYGVDAIRNDGRGGHSIGLLVQLDWAQAKPLFNLEMLSRLRGLQQIFNQ